MCRKDKNAVDICQKKWFNDDVKKLKISDALPDLTKAIGQKESYVSKPTAEYDIVDNSYTVNKLKISDDLPDLADVMAHPEKYKAPEPEAVVVDEDALLNNIMNVSFKPFDDGTREFEILNEFDTPTVSDIAQEFSQFENFSIASDDNIPVASSESTNDDFETLFNNEYVDFDNPEHVNQALVENTEEQLQIAKQESSAKDLLEKIRRRREEREAAIVEDVQQATEELLVKPVQKKEAVKLDSDVQCVIDGESFKVLSSVNFSENTGCHLVKNSSGYAVMAYIGDKLTKIKTFDELKSEKIQARLSEVLDDGSCRYLIRVGIAKFIVNANSSSVEFIMDL